MAFLFERETGGDIQYNPPRVIVRYKAKHTPSSLPGGDFFSFVASVALIQTPLTWFEPALGGVLYRQDIQVHENYYAKDYEITVPYGIQKREGGAYQITVDQTGGSVHVTAGTRISGWGPKGGGTTTIKDANGNVTTLGTEPNPGTPNAMGYENNGGLIGKDGDQIHGVDIPVEETKISVSFRHPQGQLNQAYIRRVGKLVGYPNNDTFLGYKAGEVMYLGGNFTETDTEATASYSFAISYNITEDDAFTIGTNPSIAITEKKGWDIISPIYQRATEDGVSVRKLKYVEIIRPAGREFKNYAAATGFGWGG